jgi:hypothetical protein
MDFGALRDLALDLNLNVHGFPVTVTRPFPDDTPVVTRGLWLRVQNETQPFGRDLRNVQPRRALVLPLLAITAVPRGSTITAPAKLGGPDQVWKADGAEQPTETDHLVVTVVAST